MKTTTLPELAKQMHASAEELAKQKTGVCFWPLGQIQNNNWAIVIGWDSGYEKDPEDPYSDDTWHIAVKLAYQPSNSMMQCDYDVDWLMPYDKETGDVDDTSSTVYPDTDFLPIAEDLISRFSVYQSAAESE